MDFLNPYYLQIIVFALINVIMALSVFFAFTTGQITLGTAGFMSVGAYVSAVLVTEFNLPMFVTVLVSSVVSSLVALLISGLTTRLNGLYLTIATIGFSEIIRVIFLNWVYIGGALGINGIPALGNDLTNLLAASGILNSGLISYIQLKSLVQIVILIFVIVLIFYFWKNLKKSKVGRAFQAIRLDAYASELAGINVAKYKTLSFVMSAFVAGLAGAFYAHTYSSINPADFSFNKSVDALLYVVFGGSEVILGSIFGALSLTIIPEMLRSLAEYREMLYGILLLVMMIFRPQGLITEDLLYDRKRSATKDDLHEYEEEES